MIEKLYEVNDIKTQNIDNCGSSDLMISVKRNNLKYFDQEVFDLVYKKYRLNKNHLNFQRKDGYTAYLVAAECLNDYAFGVLKDNKYIDKDLFYKDIQPVD